MFLFYTKKSQTKTAYYTEKNGNQERHIKFIVLSCASRALNDVMQFFCLLYKFAARKYVDPHTLLSWTSNRKMLLGPALPQQRNSFQIHTQVTIYVSVT